MKRLTKFSFILLLFFIVFTVAAQETFKKNQFVLNNKTYTLEIAESTAQKSMGLMFRDQLASDQGMLFRYQHPGQYRIWMKNTRIPLSVLWLDSQATIREKKLLQPCLTDPCPAFGIHQDILYIIELSQSEIDRFKVGDRLPQLLR